MTNTTVDSSANAAAALPVVSVLVVEPSLPDALSILSALTANRLQVTVAETFEKAKERLNSRAPEVLVTEVRLAEYNGLHLVLRARSVRPDIASIVMSGTPDPVLQADAEAMGATFLVKPIGDRDLAAAVFRTIFLQRSATRGSGPLRPPYERRSAERRATVVPIQIERRAADRRRDVVTIFRVITNPSSSSS